MLNPNGENSVESKETKQSFESPPFFYNTPSKDNVVQAPNTKTFESRLDQY